MIAIVQYWELVKHLTAREIKARYKQSFLGFFWIILNPFFQMIILSFVFSHILRFSELGVPYPVFLYAGLLPWIFFAQSLSSAMGVFETNSALIKKIYFPRQILIFATIVAKSVDFFLSAIVFIALMLWFKVQLSWFMVLFFPLFIIQFLFIYGLALFLATMNLFYRDVQYLFNLILTLWFYVTPVLYAVEFFPEKYQWIFKLNPMSVFINAYRQVLLARDIPNIGSLTIGVAVSLLFLFVAYGIFKKLEGTFADVV